MHISIPKYRVLTLIYMPLLKQRNMTLLHLLLEAQFMTSHYTLCKEVDSKVSPCFGALNTVQENKRSKSHCILH